MKVSLFLGAGASAAYLMPTTREFKEYLAKKRARGAKEGADGAKGGGLDVWSDLLSDSNGLDIEHVLLLADTVDALYKTEHGGRLIAGSGRLGRALEDAMRLGEEARSEVFRQYAWNHDFDMVVPDTLGPLVRMAMGLNGDGRVAVFTTNYDRAVEELCEAGGLAMHDGFWLDTKTGRRKWTGKFGAGRGGAAAPGAVRLYKLHGSLDWKRSTKHGVLRIDYDGSADGTRHKDTVIHPSLADKAGEIAAEPYRTIHEAFKRELESSDACVVVGFSFRDRLIADEFRKFAEDLDKTLIVVGPDSYKDANRRILGREPPDGGGPDRAGIPVMTSASADGREIRRAAVIGQALDVSTAFQIAARAGSAIESDHRLWPAHTLGECAYCREKTTIDYMDRHASKCFGVRKGRGALMLRIVKRTTGAPWLLALARPDAALGDLAKFLQAEWIGRHSPDAKPGRVRFAGNRRSDDLGAATALPDVRWADVSVWCNETDILQVDSMAPVKAGELREPVGMLAWGEKPPFE